ncbi:MAG: hypothetical protein M3373_05095 [Gemmatimonadota bacterium]|nr:hypothetical protein [Gemmatimonadota bacterium]
MKLAVLALCLRPGAAGAQHAQGVTVVARSPIAVDSLQVWEIGTPSQFRIGIAVPAPLPPPAVREKPWWTPISSAILPGSGQVVQGQRRGVPYLAAEAFLAAQYVQARNDGRAKRRDYQDLAQIARAIFTSTFPAGDFEYYERMEQFVESGAYDVEPGGALEPETDPTTFNGFTWELARRTFWEEPDVAPPPDSHAYREAIEFYARRAVTSEFQWSWRNAQLEQDLFRRTIQSSNSAFRRSSDYLAMIIANHVLSAVDAFIIVRLSRRGDVTSPYRLDATIPWAPFGRPRDTPPGRP